MWCGCEASKPRPGHACESLGLSHCAEQLGDESGSFEDEHAQAIYATNLTREIQARFAAATATTANS